MKIIKARVSLKRTSIQFLIAFLVAGTLFFLILLNFFIFTPFGINQIIVITIFVGISILFYILAIFNHYFVVGEPGVIYQKFTRRRVFKYDEIIYINKEKTNCSNNIIFVTKYCQTELTIPKDKSNLVYSTMLKRCKNLINKEEMEKIVTIQKK